MHKSATLLALAVTTSLAAQTAATITDANTTFTYSSYPTATNSAVGYCNFAAATTDHAYQSWWYYAVQGDATGAALNTAGGQMTASLAADNRSVLLSWPNVDARGFSAQLVNCVYSTGATSGVSAQALTITNNTANALGINLYFYTDLDVAGAAGDSASQHAGWPTGNHMVQDSAGVQCWVMADGRTICNKIPCITSRFPSQQFQLVDAPLGFATKPRFEGLLLPNLAFPFPRVYTSGPPHAHASAAAHPQPDRQRASIRAFVHRPSDAPRWVRA